MQFTDSDLNNYSAFRNAVINAYQDLVRLDIDRIINNRCLSSDDISSVVKDTNILQSILRNELLVPCCYAGSQCPCGNGFRTYHGVLIKSLLNLKFYPFNEYMPLVEYEILRDNSGQPGIKEFRHDIKQVRINDLIQKIENMNCSSKIKEAAKIVLNAFVEADISSVSRYQEDYIISYVINRCANSQKHYVIDAPTGSGKTLIFAFMALFESLLGNRTIIIYPRKQLAEDQANTLLRYVYHVRNALNTYKWSHIFNFNTPSISIVDGDHPNNLSSYLRNRGMSGSQQRLPLSDVIKKSLKCPSGNANADLYIDSNGAIKCSNGDVVDYLYVFKDDLIDKQPSIIITNRYIVLTRLLHKKVDIKKLLRNVKLVIFDEAHVYINLEGGDTAFLIRNLRNLVNDLFNYDLTFILSSATIPDPLGYAVDLLGINRSSIVHFNFNDPKYSSNITRLIIPILLLPTPSFSAETVAQFVALATLLWAHNYHAKALMFVDSREEVSRLRHYLKEVILSRGGIDYPSNLRQPGDLIIYHTSQGINNLMQHPRYLNYTVDCNALWDDLVIDPNNKTNLLNEPGWTNILNNELEAHYAWITGPQRTQLFDQFKNGNIKMLISTSTLELGIDIPDVSVIIQYKLPFRRESFIQRLGRAGRNPESYRIVIGVLILSQSPTSAAYMYEPDLAQSLVDISKLPKLPVNINNYKLRLKHEFYKLLINRKLKGKDTYYPRW